MPYKGNKNLAIMICGHNLALLTSKRRVTQRDHTSAVKCSGLEWMNAPKEVLKLMMDLRNYLPADSAYKQRLESCISFLQPLCQHLALQGLPQEVVRAQTRFYEQVVDEYMQRIGPLPPLDSSIAPDWEHLFENTMGEIHHTEQRLIIRSHPWCCDEMFIKSHLVPCTNCASVCKIFKEQHYPGKTLYLS